MSMTEHRADNVPLWTIGERMAKARDSVGMTQTDMAERLGVSRRSITRHETAGDPPRAIVLAYATATGVPLWWLLGEEPGQGGGDRRSTPSSTKWQATPSPLKLAA